MTDTTAQVPRRTLVRRGRRGLYVLGDWLAERGLISGDMSKADRARWAAARSLAGIGEVTAAWLYGDVWQTPDHCGAPMEETLPYLGVLAACNLAGFVTDGSQAGARAWWGECEAWVTGYVTGDGLARLREAIAGSPLVIATLCRGRQHHHDPIAPSYSCPRSSGFYAERCPDAAAEIADAWHLTLVDPEPGRNDRLWPALAVFAGTAS